ncbi:oligopeptide/dipeptide ABC transporter ATP-binding protein [Aquisalimonas sp. APHAB1-3]|uniref:oligopeptide/dipeptide ABC transporter ATP-binding protein n=1 Tax=Aquisalimonas sp. APHAB1-3 TaxID=3402080 RepID=UPI003AAEB124
MAHTAAPERTQQGNGITTPDTAGHVCGGPRLRVENLTVSFDDGEGGAHIALRDVSFDIKRRSCVGIIGEAGAGKTLTARSLQPHHLPADARMDGRMLLDGEDIREWPPGSAGIQVLTRNPMNVLNPVRTTGQQLTDAFRHRHDISDRFARQLALEAMEQVGIPTPRRSLSRYPHHFSGAMRYRVMAAALTINPPRMLVMDQPLGLDHGAQAELTGLLCDIADRVGSAVLLLSRTPALIAGHCDRLVSLYAGELMENARTDDLLQRPAHPYTAALLEGAEAAQTGMPPAATACTTSEGCLFRGICPHAMAGCERSQPMVVDQRGRRARCWRHGELNLRAVGG